jgi:response regulator RpfG family c-di-GMP phosphodiesterase
MNPTTSRKILLVDDEQSLLDGLRRSHRKGYDLTCALGGAAGLDALDREGPFAVVVSDQQMPGMDGITLLRKIAELSPDTCRVMLTGNADLDTAIGAVNEGSIFRFLTKPCPAETFSATLDAALEQYRLRKAEKLLLEETLRGSVEVLADVLALANPGAFGRAVRIRDLVHQMVTILQMDDAWLYETAALLSQIGLVALPADLVEKLAAGECSGEEYDQVMSRHPSVARELLEKIPRLERVAEVIALQRMSYGDARKSDQDPEVLRGGQILGLASDFEELISMGARIQTATDTLAGRTGRYSPKLLSLLGKLELRHQSGVERAINLPELRIGMHLASDVRSKDGATVVTKGQRVTRSLIARLRNYDDLRGIVQPIKVRVGVADNSAAA